jgi:hypothetical protein
MRGPTRIFWANLTPCSLQGEYLSARELRVDKQKHVRPLLEPHTKFGARKVH